MDETDHLIAAAFAASPRTETIDDFLERYDLCIEKLKERRAAAAAATPEKVTIDIGPKLLGDPAREKPIT